MKNYINKIKGNLSIYATQKTSNLLDGTHRSMYKGKSMNFDDLREYTPNDDIKDIDWKASAKSRNLLVKQYVAEKKHNVLLVIDTNKKMLGASIDLELKKEIALMAAGTLGYISTKNNDVVSAIYSTNKGIELTPFKSRLDNLELTLAKCDSSINEKNNSNINDVLEFVRTKIPNRMIIIVVSDIDGMENINDKYLKQLTYKNEVLFVCVSDAYVFGKKVFNLDKNKYLPRFITNSKKLLEDEKKARNDLYKNLERKYKKHRIVSVSINNCKEIPYKIIKLLEGQKYENKR